MKLLFTVLLALQTPAAGPAPVTIEEYLQLRDLANVRLAPEGGAVAFTVTATDLDANEYRTELHLWVPGTGTRSVTGAREGVSAPRWSPDGDRIAFLAPVSHTAAGDPEEPKPQIWLLPVRTGGEAVQLTDLPGGVLDYGWANDTTIYVLTTERDAPLLRALRERDRERGDDPIIVRDGAELRKEFWRIAVPDGAAERLWGGDHGIAEMAISPDGGRIAYTTNYSGATGDYHRFDLWLLNTERGEPRQLTDRAGAERFPVWSPDGERLVVQAPQNTQLSYSQTELLEIRTGDGEPRSLTDSFDRTVLTHAWPHDGDLLFRATLGTHTHLFAVRANGAVERLTTGPYNYGAFDGGGDGTLYVVREAAHEPAELWRIRGHDASPITSLNDRVERWSLARQELIRWSAPDGLAVEGLLVYPLGYREGQRYPLLVHAHGGPFSRVRDVLDQFYLYQPFAARGYAVLAPNFRGSTGYGEAFGTANRRDLGGGDFQDLMGGVDLVIEMGVADSARLGIYGGSYGGYMTNWAITQTDRFRAAVSLYGIFNLITDYSNSSIPGWGYDYLRSYYWEDIDAYLDRSPMRHVTEIETPVLIVHGTEDPNTFVANSNEMFRALRDLGRTVQFVKYPREGHGIREPRHRIDLFFRQLRWFDRYLKFGGLELFDFYLVDEWVPGPEGWELRVVEAEPRDEYTGVAPAEGRFLEVTMVLRPDTAAAADGAVRPIELDLARDLQLVGPNGGARSAAGTVIELFDQKTLVSGGLGAIQVRPAGGGSAGALAVAVAFEIGDGAAEYRLQALSFAPVRIWVEPGSTGE